MFNYKLKILQKLAQQREQENIFEIKENGNIVNVGIKDSNNTHVEKLYAQINKENKTAFVYELKIDKDFRGQGIGKDIVEKFKKLCKKYGVIKIMLIPENKKAKEFWDKQGMEYFDRKDKSEYDKDMPYKRGLTPLMVKKFSIRTNIIKRGFDVMEQQVDIKNKLEEKYKMKGNPKAEKVWRLAKTFAIGHGVDVLEDYYKIMAGTAKSIGSENKLANAKLYKTRILQKCSK
jgi:GNAT superfamily N-acetyltransferase